MSASEKLRDEEALQSMNNFIPMFDSGNYSFMWHTTGENDMSATDRIMEITRLKNDLKEARKEAEQAKASASCYFDEVVARDDLIKVANKCIEDLESEVSLRNTELKMAADENLRLNNCCDGYAQSLTEAKLELKGKTHSKISDAFVSKVADELKTVDSLAIATLYDQYKKQKSTINDWEACHKSLLDLYPSKHIGQIANECERHKNLASAFREIFHEGSVGELKSIVNWHQQVLDIVKNQDRDSCLRAIENLEDHYRQRVEHFGHETLEEIKYRLDCAEKIGNKKYGELGKFVLAMGRTSTDDATKDAIKYKEFWDEISPLYPNVHELSSFVFNDVSRWQNCDNNYSQIIHTLGGIYPNLPTSEYANAIRTDLEYYKEQIAELKVKYHQSQEDVFDAVYNQPSEWQKIMNPLIGIPIICVASIFAGLVIGSIITTTPEPEPQDLRLQINKIERELINVERSIREGN